MDLAVRRILLLHSLILAFGGLPLLYMGDEIGLLNDDRYLQDPNLAGDNRWLHRPMMDWELAEKRDDGLSANGRIFQTLRRLITARKQTPALHAEAAARPVWTHNIHVFGLLRESPHGRLLILGNFSDHAQTVPFYRLAELGFDGPMRNKATDETIPAWADLQIEPYGYLWLEKE